MIQIAHAAAIVMPLGSAKLDMVDVMLESESEPHDDALAASGERPSACADDDAPPPGGAAPRPGADAESARAPAPRHSMCHRFCGLRRSMTITCVGLCWTASIVMSSENLAERNSTACRARAACRRRRRRPTTPPPETPRR